MDYLIDIVAHQPEWAALYADEVVRLRALFGSQFVTAHHIGSTAVPGLKAKPIIDILLEVHDIEQVAHYNEPMHQLGYEAMGEFGLPGRRFFRKDINGRRTLHIHTWQTGNSEFERHLAFRDYLIAHPDQAQAYSDLKEDLAARFAGDRKLYVAGKDAFCQETEKKALAWQRELRAYELAGERLRLVPLSAAQLYFCLHRPDQLEAEFGLPISREVVDPPVVQHALRVKKQRLINSPAAEFPWHTYWLIIIRSVPFGAGLIGFKGMPDNNSEVEIGYGIDPAWRNRGYTTEAAKMLIDWALQQDSCLAVTAWSDKDNVASARVLQKVGMKLGRETDDQFCWVIGKRQED